MAELTIQQIFEQGGQHHQAGRLQEAERLYRLVLSRQPNHPGALHLLGLIAQQAGQSDKAVELIRRAIALRPNYADAYGNLGLALARLGRLDEAIAAFGQVIALNPNSAEAHSNRGIILANKGQLDEAISAFGKAIALKPNYGEAHNNLGIALAHTGRPHEAIAAFRQAVVHSPDLADAHTGLGRVLLSTGQLQAGWRELEWRWLKPTFTSRPRNFPQPQWDGSDLAGRTLHIHAEQGFGDTIQFCRYVPLLTARGHKVNFECQSEVLPLIRNSPGFDTLIPDDDPLPPFDLHCPLMSVPLAMGTELETIPASVPYLYPLPEQVAHWQAKLSSDPGRLKVGLAWAGRPSHTNDRNRSCRLADLAPLASVPDVSFYSLQKGEAAAQLQSPPPGMKLFDAGKLLTDFADTAALIACLDLVVAVDTSVVHVAGAMARPVWTLLPYCPDWRWLLDRPDSPWYPTMRLFRQQRRGDWATVLLQAAQALSQFQRG